MNVLIVHAHENERSFCSALKDRAVDFCNRSGHGVEVSDLYAMEFNPVAQKKDFKSLSGQDYYKLQAEQIHAARTNRFADDIAGEMEKFMRAQVVIFNFPLWWFSMPAILKGWVDRVFAMGFAYGDGKGTYEQGAFADKKAFATITTGGERDSYGPGSKNGDMETILYHIQHGVFYFVGMQTLPPFIVYGPGRLDDKERASRLADYEAYLADLHKTAPIFPVLSPR